MKTKHQTDRQSTSSSNEFVCYDAAKKAEIWRTPSGRLVEIQPVINPEEMVKVSSEFETKNSGFKILEEGNPVLRVDEVEYRGSTPTEDHVPELFKFKGLVARPDGGLSSIDIESENSMTMSEIATLILG